MQHNHTKQQSKTRETNQRATDNTHQHPLTHKKTTQSKTTQTTTLRTNGRGYHQQKTQDFTLEKMHWWSLKKHMFY